MRFSPQPVIAAMLSLVAVCPAVVTPASAAEAIREIRSRPAPETLTNLSSTLAANRQFSTLSAAIEAAGLSEALAEIETATIFAPTNRAFRRIPAADLESLLGDADSLAAILLYHVVPENRPSTSLEDGELPTLLDGTSLTLNVTRYWNHYLSIGVEDARVGRSDLPATNGTIHAIDTVLDPAAAPAPTLLEAVGAHPDFTTFFSLLQQAHLTHVLDVNSRRITVFAPTNAAFEDIPAAALARLLSDRRALRKALLNHIVLRPTTTDDLLLGSTTVRTAARNSLRVSSTGSVPPAVSIGAATITATDSAAANGIVHIIDTVLLPGKPRSLADLIASRDDLRILAEAFTASGFAETLGSPRSSPTFTIFGPADDAFASLPEGNPEILLADPTGSLAALLRLHIVPGKITAKRLRDGQKLVSIGGDHLSVAVSEEGAISINGCPIAVPDLLAENGVLHVIGSVLEDSAFTLADLLATKPYLSRFAAAIDDAGLTETLADPDAELTLLAPLDSAFRRLPDGVTTDVLKNHLVHGRHTVDDLSAARRATTTLGTELPIGSKTFQWHWFPFRRITVDGATLIVTDLAADNGLLHIITRVLLPEE